VCLVLGCVVFGENVWSVGFVVTCLRWVVLSMVVAHFCVCVCVYGCCRSCVYVLGSVFVLGVMCVSGLGVVCVHCGFECVMWPMCGCGHLGVSCVVL